MLIEHRGSSPKVDSSAWIAPTAVLSGRVSVGPGSRILHGAVVSAEDGEIRVGTNVVVMENAVIRARASHPVVVGDSVMIGPHAHVNGSVVGDSVFVATGASLFPGSALGAGAEVRVNAVVQVNTIVGEGTVIPIGWVAVGNPAQLFSPDRHDEIWEIQRTLDFVGSVYGVAPGTPMSEIMKQQSEWFGEHRSD
jgi:carbonic anhydrase/acetyltransferase-like protein (isoleucine patch superfamily)